MERSGVFKGNLFTDLLAWGGAGLLIGGAYGYLVTEAYNRWRQPKDPKDPVWVGNRDAYRGAVFFGLVAATGHLLRTIFY
jgi:hypothetical protein